MHFLSFKLISVPVDALHSLLCSAACPARRRAVGAEGEHDAILQRRLAHVLLHALAPAGRLRSAVEILQGHLPPGTSGWMLAAFQ